ncbi:MAG: hypothetical protein IPM01_03585 [Burkholderiaceae bacterium]|nr:hypothetical protein [Burkholderiaceae bacterium]
MSSKTARIAGAASVLGGSVFHLRVRADLLAYSATLVDPAWCSGWSPTRS